MASSLIKLSNHSVFFSSHPTKKYRSTSLSIRAASSQKRSFGNWVLKRTSYSPCLAQTRSNTSFRVLSSKKDWFKKVVDSTTDGENSETSGEESEIEAEWISTTDVLSSKRDWFEKVVDSTTDVPSSKRDWFEKVVDSSTDGENSETSEESETEAEWISTTDVLSSKRDWFEKVVDSTTDVPSNKRDWFEKVVDSSTDVPSSKRDWFEKVADSSTDGENSKTSEEVTGTESILSRLEKEQNQSLGLCSKGKQRNNKQDDLHLLSPEVHSNERSTRSVPANSRMDSLDDFGTNLLDDSGTNASSNPVTWRTFSYQRTTSESEFEAGDIGEFMTTNDEKVAEITRNDLKFGGKERDQNPISSHLHHLESELASLHCGLSSQENSISDQGEDNTLEEMHMLSDASEFQENEVMSSQEKLQLLCVQFAILEGKMALANFEAQREVKEKRILGQKKVLSLLRTTCIDFPNCSASEVLLVGSFDGWKNQRRMEMSSSGSFSLYLKLYPGQYEIKFIVDGEWVTDPLLPVVNKGGSLNNLLIVY